MSKFLSKIAVSILIIIQLASCTSTKYFNDADVEVVSESKDDSSIHFKKNTQTVKVDNTPDVKLIAFYTFGMPFVVAGCTVREAGRVAGYSCLNLLLGSIAYKRNKAGKESMGFIIPDSKKAKNEYDTFQQKYEESDSYKYRQYRKSFSKAVIIKQNVIEEIDWNDQTKVVSSETETIKLQTSVSDSAERVSKKASLLGCRIGTVSSIIFGIPSYIVGYIFSVYEDFN